MKVRTLLATAVSLLLISATANATVGVAIGAHTWASDGYPDLGPGEQAKLFVCHGKTSLMDGPTAVRCAVEKCKAYFKVPPSAKPDKAGIVGKCKAGGYSERNGYALGYVGDPGDNERIMTEAVGRKTREDAERLVREDNFPIKEKNKVFDFYDDGVNGKDTFTK